MTKLVLPIDNYVPSTAAVDPILLWRATPDFADFLARPDSAEFVSLLDYWDSRRGAEPAPLRAAIDPADLSRLLPGIFIMEVIDGPPLDFRFRLVGTNIIGGLRANFTGKTLREVFPLDGMFATIWKQYRAAIQGDVVLRVGVDGFEDHQYRFRVPISVILLPLRTTPDSTRIGQLLGYVKYYKEKMERVDL
jgi:hypothetical protein